MKNMLVILFILSCTPYFPVNSIPLSFIWDIIFGKGGNIPRVRSVEIARSMGSFAILDFIGLVERQGYPAEEHYLTTKDGYNLRVHRIPGSPSKIKSEGKPVAFIQHGFLASSDSFVLMGPGKDLAFLLADSGYDVWLGNHRGNTYSRSHQKLSPDRDSSFWEFSYHEIALYDVADTIDYILGVSGEKSLIYIGHSMGTTASFVLLSTKPEYNEKIRLNICLSPIAFWKHKQPPYLQFVINYGAAIQSLVQKNKLYEFLPLTVSSAKAGMSICSEGSILQPLCINFFNIISGYDVDQFNTKALPYILSYFPAGTSTQIAIHYLQNIVSGEFQTFDHGGAKNFFIYGQEKPPMYNLENVRAPVALIYGEGDILSRREDSEELNRKLPNVLTFEKVPYKNFTHLDFIWAKDIKSLLHDRIIYLMSKSESETEIGFANSTSYSV